MTKSKFGSSSTTTIYKETNYVMTLLTYSGPQSLSQGYEEENNGYRLNDKMVSLT